MNNWIFHIVILFKVLVFGGTFQLYGTDSLTLSAIALSTYNGPYNVSCHAASDGIIELQIEGGIEPYIVSWSTGQNATRITDLAAGEYSVTITDQSDCMITSAVTLVAPEPITASVNTIPIGCVAEKGFIEVTEIVGGVGPYSIYVNDYPNPGEGIFGWSDSATYEVVVKDVNGCHWTQEVLLEEEQVLIDLPFRLDTILGSVLTLKPILAEPSLSYSWKILSGQGVLSTPIGSSTNIQVLSELVKVELTGKNENGCFATDRVQIFSTIKPLGFVPNSFSPNNDGRNDLFQFFPGPAIKSIQWMRIYDRQGNLVYQAGKHEPSQALVYAWDGNFQGKRAPSSTYIYTIMVSVKDGREEFLSGSLHLMRW